MKTIVNHSNRTYVTISDDLSTIAFPFIKFILKDASLEASSLDSSIAKNRLLYKPYLNIDDFLSKGLETSWTIDKVN